jgi:O-antigen ligase
MGFFLFILVNAALFVRPGEISPNLAELPIYLVLIVCCLAFSFLAVIKQFLPDYLATRPTTVCALGMCVAVILSHVSRAALYEAKEGTIEMIKAVLFYLLVVGLVTSWSRLKSFSSWLVIYVFVMTSLVLLQFQGVIDVESFRPLTDKTFSETEGDYTYSYRLQGLGLFNDPNDFCLILSVAIFICLYRMGNRKAAILRIVWLVPLALFGYALILTKSRGGMLNILAGFAVLFYFRFGWRKTIPLVAMLMVGYVAIGGRAAEIDVGVEGGTGQQRIQYWSEALEFFFQSPLFGIGHDQFREQVNHVTHNSFLQAFAEMGMFGGVLFLGLFCCPFWMVRQVGGVNIRIPDAEVRRFRPFLLAMITSYAVGLATLSRNYVVPTYLVPGLATAYCELCRPYVPRSALRFGLTQFQKLVILGVVFLFVMYVFARVLVVWS